MLRNIKIIGKKLFVITMIALITSDLSAQYSGGTGSMSDPYQIASLENLRTLSLTASDWSYHFILTADIDAYATENWNDGKGFSPIGQSDTAFTGNFDGGGFTISGLYIKRSQTMYNGMFGKVSGALISNLNLNNFYVEGGSYTGCLVGSMSGNNTITTGIHHIIIANSSIKGGPWLGGVAGWVYSAGLDSCQVAVTILSGLGVMGGLVGDAYSAGGCTIKNCSVILEINGLSASVGGFIGMNNSIIIDCYAIIKATATINNHGNIGGFAGQNLNIIENCYASGEILLAGNENYMIGGFTGYNNGMLNNCYSSVSVMAENGQFVGGMVGQNNKTIKNCFSIRSVTGKDQVGGLVGRNSANSEITNCYAAGNVTGLETIGGFLGENDENTLVTNCYATCLVTGTDITGGFVGENGYNARITNCYASVEVRCEASFSGGFAGLNRSYALTVNCFFDREASGKISGIGMDYNGLNLQPVDLTTNEFNNQNIFLDADWSFGNTDLAPWKMGTAPDSLKRPVLFYHNYVVKFLANEGGVVGPDSLLVQTVNCGEKTDTVTAQPDEYYYFVKWQNLTGDSITTVNPLVIENVMSDSTLVAVFRSTFGIDETPGRYVKIYPNPVNEVLCIEMNGKFIFQNTIIEIYDINGKLRLHLRPTSGSIHIGTKSLDCGLYLIKIQEDNNIITKKFVIQ